MSLFENLLGKDGSVAIHNKNLQTLVTAIFKVSRGIQKETKAEHFFNLR